MSTVIYTAYRSKLGVNPFALSEKIRDTLMPKIEDKIRDQVKFWQAMPEVEFRAMVTNMELKRPNGMELTLPDKLTPLTYSDVLQACYKNQAINPYKNSFDLNFRLTFRGYKNRVYVIPCTGCFYGNGSLTSKWVESVPGLEEYGYWNNTDQPDNISNQAWAKRSEAWNYMIENKWDNYLTIELVTIDNFFQVSPIWKDAWTKKR